MPTLRNFRFWCQNVLPLVYDESLSYYEVLCKVVDYINKLIDADKEIFSDLDELKRDMNVVEKWIADFDTSYFEELLKEYIPVTVFFGLTDSGNFVAYIPENWSDITFNTTEYDISLDIMPQFGHLVLSY